MSRTFSDFIIEAAPIANAGPGQTVHEGATVTLDGSGSSDPYNLVPLTYAWSILSKPVGSAAILSNATAVHPTFVADLTGNYVIQLVVTNNVNLQSPPATVTISTTNTAPVADAGPDQAVMSDGSTVQLDGSKSYDPDGDMITYAWTMITKPKGSAAKLANARTAKPTFVADVHGTYIIKLIVSDPWVASTPKTVTVSFTNVAPVANAGTSQSVSLGERVYLDGSGSADANFDRLTYQWSFASEPCGGRAIIANPTAVKTSFMPHVAGTYVVQLIVNDGFVNSKPSTVNIRVVVTKSTVTLAVQALERFIGKLDPRVFKNANMQNSMINKLNAVLGNIDASNYKGALNQIENDILSEVDGVAITGKPDKDDWIIDRSSQLKVYKRLKKIIEEMKVLMGHS
jgi:hypothetical protein